jgi:hypothetical protein
MGDRIAASDVPEQSARAPALASMRVATPCAGDAWHRRCREWPGRHACLPQTALDGRNFLAQTD